MAQEFKQLHGLNEINLQKVYSFALDIEEKMQLAFSHPLVIPADAPPRFKLLKDAIPYPQKRYRYSDDLVRFLEKIKAIKACKYDQALDNFHVELDMDRFKQFKKEADVLWSERLPDGDPLETTSAAPRKTDHKKTMSEDALYEIKYTIGQEILINGFHLSTTCFDGENDNVFTHLFENPNKKITLEELERALKKPVKKNFHKILENLGFTGDLLKAFFVVSKNGIVFRNPLFPKDLEALGIKYLRLSKSSANNPKQP